jgi:hypothetical protein
MDESGLKSISIAKLFVNENFRILINRRLTAAQKNFKALILAKIYLFILHSWMFNVWNYENNL